MTEHMSPIPSRVYNAAVGGHVCGPEDVDFGQKVVHLIKYDRAGNEVSFESQVTQANKIYVIHDDFTLSSDITVPANCVLEFEGGSVSGNNHITFNNTLIQGDAKFYNSYNLGRISNTSINMKWFGLVGDGVTDNSLLFNNVLKMNVSNKTLEFESGIYYFTSTITVPTSLEHVYIKAISSTNIEEGSNVTFKTDKDITILHLASVCNKVEGIRFYATTKQSTIGIKMCRVADSELSTETNGVLASIDSTIVNCSFENLSQGVYIVGNHCTILRCIFSNCLLGINISSFSNANLSPIYMGASTRVIVIDGCYFHGQYSSYKSVKISSDKVVGVVVQNCYHDTAGIFIEAETLTNCLVQNNLVMGLTSRFITANNVDTTIISGNQIICDEGNGSWRSNGEKTFALRGIDLGIIIQSIISNNMFSGIVAPITIATATNITITSNIFKDWNDETASRNAAIAIPVSNHADGILIANNEFLHGGEANSCLVYARGSSCSTISIVGNYIASANIANLEYFLAGTSDNLDILDHPMIKDNKVKGQLYYVTSQWRPTNCLYRGMEVFDVALNKPIYYDGNGGWKDATGTTV